MENDTPVVEDDDCGIPSPESGAIDENKQLSSHGDNSTWDPDHCSLSGCSLVKGHSGACVVDETRLPLGSEASSKWVVPDAVIGD